MFSKIYNPVMRARSCVSLLNKTAKTEPSRWMSSDKISTKTPGKVVFISQSSDIFTNLAFEDWLYQNMTFSNRQVLFLWSNDPCVVIGRHQNPYVELNLPYLENAKVAIARRKSGGGTVYHDRGNLNCSFFSPRERYDRKWNLQVICKALMDDFEIKSEIDCKDNIMIDGYKVSGTAAKLGRLSCYHHCTLLVDSDHQQLKLTLKGDKTVDSKATPSVPSSVMNLRDLRSTLSVEGLLASVGRSYLNSSLPGAETTFSNSNGYTLVNPTNDWFPGLDAIKAELLSWKWKYGMTPKFTITRPVTLPECLIHDKTVNISVETYHGMIQRVSLEEDVVPQSLAELIHTDIGSGLKGARYTPEVFQEIVNRLRLPRKYASQRSAM